MGTVPLTHGPVPYVIAAVGIVALAWLAAVRGRRWWLRRVPAGAVAAGAATAGLVYLVENVWRPFPDALPAPVILAAGGALLALTLAALRWSFTHGWWRLAIPLCTVFAVVAAASLVNVYFGEYPTVDSLLPGPLANQVQLDQLVPPSAVVVAPPGKSLGSVWQRPAGLPTHGATATVRIPPLKSGFQARPAMVYLPPAYLSSPRATLPVLVLMSGSPGSPHDWFGGGLLAQRMDRFAAAHNGLAPVVVVPDILGSALANPLCMDSKLGKAATYVDVDVPAWITTNLQVDTDTSRWAIAGLSSGGTCALQAAIRSPKTYPTFVDISGQDEPTLGGRARTVDATFGGDAAAFEATLPLHQLVGKSLPGSSGMLTVGDRDKMYGPQQRHVEKALKQAGVPVKFVLIRGAHTWAVFGAALEKSLPWLATRSGLA
jgi:S-formylglutathione hydrolase FrmB